ncbi:MAG: hypothetical protein ABIW57_03825, partial [Polyangia bacterium]
MRNSFLRLVGSCCCVVLCALVGCGSDSAREFGTMGDGSMATGGARGGPLDAGAEHPSASGGMVGSSGGDSGTGGAMAGTGGSVAASGGASGTGGVTASGGVTGSGGNGSGSDTCDQLAADYQK